METAPARWVRARRLPGVAGRIRDDDIAEVNLPTGVPMRYELGPDMVPVQRVPLTDRYLGDAEAAQRAAEAVARQAG